MVVGDEEGQVVKCGRGRRDGKQRQKRGERETAGAFKFSGVWPNHATDHPLPDGVRVETCRCTGD